MLRFDDHHPGGGRHGAGHRIQKTARPPVQQSPEHQKQKVVVDEGAAGADRIVEDSTELKYPFKTAKDLLHHCVTHGLSISQVMMTNECAWRPEAETRSGLLNIWQVMQDCVSAGCRNEGILPGGLKVKRRAAALYRQLCSNPEAGLRDALSVLDWVNLYALAVDE